MQPSHLPAFESRALAALGKVICQTRRRRSHHLGVVSEAFADPAWDLLLELYIASQSNVTMTVTAASMAAEVPQSTGLRYIDKLIAGGVATRHGIALSKRMHGVKLTPAGVLAMEHTLDDFASLLAQVGFRSAAQR